MTSLELAGARPHEGELKGPGLLYLVSRNQENI
jgi:hypothetical protein